MSRASCKSGLHLGEPEVSDDGRIEFTIPGRAPAATSPNARVSYWERHSEGNAYGMAVGLIARLCAPDAAYSRAHVTVTQMAVRLRDADNFIASFKPGLDAIVRAGIITDDNPAVIDLTIRARRVKHKADECVGVTIERLEP